MGMRRRRLSPAVTARRFTRPVDTEMDMVLPSLACANPDLPHEMARRCQRRILREVGTAAGTLPVWARISAGQPPNTRCWHGGSLWASTIRGTGFRPRRRPFQRHRGSQCGGRGTGNRSSRPLWSNGGCCPGSSRDPRTGGAHFASGQSWFALGGRMTHNPGERHSPPWHYFPAKRLPPSSGVLRAGGSSGTRGVTHWSRHGAGVSWGCSFFAGTSSPSGGRP